MYPIQGNHDTWPVNVQNFDTPNSNEPINGFKDSWMDQLWMSQEQSELFSQYGYYSKPLKLGENGKIIALNM